MTWTVDTPSFRHDADISNETPTPKMRPPTNLVAY